MNEELKPCPFCGKKPATDNDLIIGKVVSCDKKAVCRAVIYRGGK